MSGDGVCGVNGSRPRYFSPEEEEALRKDDSTSTLTNQGRRNAGMKEADVPIRGDDKTLDDVLHHPHVALGEAIGAAFHGAELGEVLIGGKVAAAVHSLGRAGVVAPPVIAFFAAQYGMYEMEKRKAELKDGATKDQLHAALVRSLDVPKGFKDSEVARLDVDTNAHSPSTKIANQLEHDKKLHAALQMHCDRGMHGAEEMIRGGQTKDAYFAAHPDAKQRYDADAAYRYGFDALVWSKSQADGGAAYEQQIKALRDRDGWYAQSCIQIRP